ncbi:hypothetical protein L6164_014949 [Bauhinia variegata]|uniref:Uncharacterized protein n=1 Tax=Bauhinia variegata TaxID=167791 RepID=A0ACB9NMN8_BAUVA|nr:hypothetical protein L6164_014949 [Bauhinia variegata]
MEGLLPLFYRTIKKKKTRRQYECLSSGTALNYEMAEFFPQSQSHVYQTTPTQKVADFSAEKKGYRRNKSVGDSAYGFSSPQQIRMNAASPTPKHLARFRSQRMFSCMTGV